MIKHNKNANNTLDKENQIHEVFNSLEQWIQRSDGWSYDICDVNAHPNFLFIQHLKRKNPLFKFLTHPIFLVTERRTNLMRKILRVKKNLFPQAFGLIARAYLSAYKSSSNKIYLEKAIEYLDWLKSNPSKGYNNFCWGQPYDWFSRKLIPKDTPRTTVTSIVSMAFLDAYCLTKKTEYLDIAKSACNFFINNLNYHLDDQDYLCFSYTSKDNFCIHNANMVASAALIRTWFYCKKNEYKEIGIKSLDFTMKNQNKDGSWYYWAPPDKIIGKIDNYHTGFILESLEVIRDYLGEEFNYDKKLESGLDFYIKNFFEDQIIPKMLPTDIYPIDIQSCAQSIITLQEFQHRYPKFRDNIINIANWTIENMYSPRGYFYYRIYKDGFVDKTPYIRWAQSWMLRALSYLIYSSDKNNRRKDK